MIRPIQCVSAFFNGTVIATGNITTSSGSLLVAIVHAFTNTIGATPVTDSKSNTWVQAIGSTGTTEGFSGMFYVENCTGGASHNFTFTPTASDFISITVLEIADAALSGALNNTAAQAQSGFTRVSGTITADGGVAELFVGGVGPQRVAQGLMAVTQGNWFMARNRAATASDPGFTAACRRVESGTTDEASFSSNSNSDNTTVLVAGFKEAVAGGGSDGVSRARVQRRM